jgi:quercetin dioxygenase-like cupin family protein
MGNLLKFPITILDMTIAQEFAQKEGIFDVDPCTVHHFSDGLYAKQMSIPAGYEACQHAHNYSHLSILAKGRVLVETDDWKKEFKAPACIEITAGVFHKITSLEDCVWFCVHATDETDPKKVDEVLIQRG